MIFGLFRNFLGKNADWYLEQEKALRTTPHKVPLLKNKTVILETNLVASLPQLLRRLDELGYEKVLHIGRFGEFAHRGGIIDVFPINSDSPIRIEFDGKHIDSIEYIAIESDLPRNEWEKIVKRTLQKPLTDVAEGEYLVHLDHGIGRFAGFKTIAIDGEDLEYYTLMYAQGDKLFVPKDLAGRKLTRYVGFTTPRVHRLGSTMWLKTKRRVRKDARKFAEELLKLYAQRSLVTRHAYVKTSTELDAFIASFPYEETPDQNRAWEEIASDLASPHPMDRLLAGDVGFGKTEIALRAAVLAVANGKQVAILAPTTVLADQHFRTSEERLRDIGINTALLTRLVDKKTQSKTIADLASGKVDVVIGTHRLLSKDIVFKRLGLVVIDEEQRFGVKHKERFKQMRSAIDVLSLSATPIPRTLAQSLANIRPVSRLQIPPAGRKEIMTNFGLWDDDVVKEALRYEKQRGGQSYVLHNRVATIHTFAQELRQLVPGLSIGIVHGRLGERALIDVMHQLRSGKIDILVATTIIENGLDLANVNTILIEESGKLGLAQAYQLRGRIGRGSTQGHAYFFWKREPEGKAALRIDALRDATALGAGWDIAMRDLEIRGAGNLLGKEQAGALNRVGFNLYAQLLAEAVESLRQEKKNSPSVSSGS